MYLSFTWLKEYVAIPKNISPIDLGDKLTTHTVEIDGVENQADKYKNIIVGKIVEVKNHPQADKLQLAIVDTGTEKLNIVCGAPNIKPGQLVPVALVGAKLPNDMQIKPAVIRGEESYGMLCAEDELALGNDHSGIMILNESAKIGSRLSDYLSLDDVIFEVDNKSITNRPDLWNHYGMAREIAVFLDSKLTIDFASKEANSLAVDNDDIKLKVKLENKKDCLRYMAVTLDNIKIESSPAWMQSRLISAGIRPINNIVDITNYVMLEMGQPMHAFDISKLNQDKTKININVRLSKAGETITTIDGEERKLADDLIIATDKNILAIAGIMGGESSEVDEQTTAIVLESANFSNALIRKSSQRLNLRTEASQRFEKALDPYYCEQAIVRAVELIKKICPTAVLSGSIIDEGGFVYHEKQIVLELTWLAKFLGKTIVDSEIIKILEKLGFAPQINEGILKVGVPSWRAGKDINFPEDIAEEIARIYGYDRIGAELPVVKMQAVYLPPIKKLINKIRCVLSDQLKMFEVSNYSFVGEKQLKTLGIDFSNYISLANPINKNQTMLRQSLATNLLDNVKRNQARFNEINIYELGMVYLPTESKWSKMANDKETLPWQEKRLGILLAGDDDNVFNKLKSQITFLLADFNHRVEFCSREKIYYWSVADYATEVKINEQVIGVINFLDKSIAKKLGLKKKVVIAELYLSEILKNIDINQDKLYQSLPKYPALIRDLAFILDETISYANISKELLNFHEYISQVELFDEYHGDKLGKGKKNLAFHIIYQADKTLSAKEVDDIQVKLLSYLQKKFEAQIRDF